HMISHRGSIQQQQTSAMLVCDTKALHLRLKDGQTTPDESREVSEEDGRERLRLGVLGVDSGSASHRSHDLSFPPSLPSPFNLSTLPPPGSRLDWQRSEELTLLCPALSPSLYICLPLPETDLWSTAGGQ
ncbi:unnamed protein product, partial [Pleuronectes platessa]